MLDRAAVFLTYNIGQKYAVLVRVLLDLKMLKFYGPTPSLNMSMKGVVEMRMLSWICGNTRVVRKQWRRHIFEWVQLHPLNYYCYFVGSIVRTSKKRLDPVAILKVVLKDKTHLSIGRFGYIFY